MKIVNLRKRIVPTFLPSPEFAADEIEREKKRVAKRAERLEKKQRKEEFAQQLRDNPTDSEKLFYDMLVRLNIKFVFQPVICGYIPDFYFPNWGRRIIEIDGSSHADKREYDKRRDEALKKNGNEVLHIRASRVFWDMPCIEWEVRSFLSGRKLYKKQWNKAKKKRPPKPKLGKDLMLAEFFHMTEGI